MNQTKATLVKVSAIFAIIDAIGCIFAGIILATTTGYFGEALTGMGMAIPGINIPREAFIAMGVVIAIMGVLSLIGGVLLLQVTGANKIFQTSSGKYKAGCALTIIGGGLVSIACLLLYISFCYKNVPSSELRSGEFNNEAMVYDYGDVSSAHESDEAVKRKINVLRQLKNKGEISDQEFKDMLIEIIKRKEQD